VAEFSKEGNGSKGLFADDDDGDDDDDLVATVSYEAISI
jgi:hypothetical protein